MPYSPLISEAPVNPAPANASPPAVERVGFPNPWTALIDLVDAKIEVPV